MAPPRPSYDPLRYGLRALEEIARTEASVAVPASNVEGAPAPPPRLRPPPRDGAALSLRMFTSGSDDATRFVLREERELTLVPFPARAATFFEAHAAAVAYDHDDDLVVGFPLVSFTQQGQRRTAPLLSWSGAQAVWKLGDKPWKLPPGVRLDTPLDSPTALSLRAPDESEEASALFTLHAGLWGYLFGFESEALAAVARVGQESVGALVRAATLALTRGGEDTIDGETVEEAPVTREMLKALAEAVVARANPRNAAQCHPHGIAMLLPRGDPTIGLRTELKEMFDEPVPRQGALAVYLGATPAEARPAPLWTHGVTAPTPSQVTAAEAFEGSRDLVAVCGPPGCGKTTLLHHVTAQAIVARALDSTWTKPPEAGTPWALVVTSTNNAAVDHALAPFARGRDVPVALRVGNRRTLAEATAETLRATMSTLMSHGDVTLTEARAEFESRASRVRAHLRALDAERKERERREVEATRLRARAEALVGLLAGPLPEVDPSLKVGDVVRAREMLVAHAKAVTRVAPLCLDAACPSIEKARRRWADANARRAPEIVPVLAQLGLRVPFHELDVEDAHADLERQHEAMLAAVERLEEVERAFRASGLRRELDDVMAALERLEVKEIPAAPPPDPSLVEAALRVRDAWARSHRAKLLPRLQEALSLVLDEPRTERRRPLPEVLASLAAVFPLVGCTLLSLRSSFVRRSDVIDRLVVDEAGQCAPLYAIPALARARRALVTGDVAQLPPVYVLDDRVDERLLRGLDAHAVEPFRMGASATTSAQAVAESRTASQLALVEHFRSQAPIVTLASSWSGHTLDVRTPPRSLAHVSPALYAPVIVHDVRGHGARAIEGIVNEPEAALAVELVVSLVRDGVAPSDIAVLSPFVGQSVRIERALFRRGLAGEDGALVRTVHKLQGGERRVVVFSVTATERRHLRWLSERPHLLHVATSRAQDHLLVLINTSRAKDELLLAPLLAPELRHARGGW